MRGLICTSQQVCCVFFPPPNIYTKRFHTQHRLHHKHSAGENVTPSSAVSEQRCCCDTTSRRHAGFKQTRGQRGENRLGRGDQQYYDRGESGCQDPQWLVCSCCSCIVLVSPPGRILAVSTERQEEGYSFNLHFKNILVLKL